MSALRQWRILPPKGLPSATRVRCGDADGWPLHPRLCFLGISSIFGGSGGRQLPRLLAIPSARRCDGVLPVPLRASWVLAQPDTRPIRHASGGRIRRRNLAVPRCAVAVSGPRPLPTYAGSIETGGWLGAFIMSAIVTLPRKSTVCFWAMFQTCCISHPSRMEQSSWSPSTHRLSFNGPSTASMTARNVISEGDLARA